MSDCYENSTRPPRHVVLRSPRRRACPVPRTPPQVPVSGYGAGSSSGTPQDDMTGWPGAIFIAIAHAGCHRHHQSWKWGCLLALSRPTPPQVPVSGYGAGSSSGTPQDDMTGWPGAIFIAIAHAGCHRHHQSWKWGCLLAWPGRPRPRSPYRGTGQAPRGSGRHSALAGCCFHSNGTRAGPPNSWTLNSHCSFPVPSAALHLPRLSRTYRTCVPCVQESLFRLRAKKY